MFFINACIGTVMCNHDISVKYKLKLKVNEVVATPASIKFFELYLFLRFDVTLPVQCDHCYTKQ